MKGHFLKNCYFSVFFERGLQSRTYHFFLATADHSFEMVSATVAKALEKAAKRATRVAEADAGLGEADPPRFPGKKKGQDLESAKEASRPDSQICKHSRQHLTLTI